MTPTNNPQQPQGWYDQLKNMLFSNALLRQLAGGGQPQPPATGQPNNGFFGSPAPVSPGLAPVSQNSSTAIGNSTDPTAMIKLADAYMKQNNPLKQTQPNAILAITPRKKASKK